MDKLENLKGAEVLRRLVNKDHLWKIEILTKWQNSFGKSLKNVSIKEVVDSKIFLVARNATISHELSMQKQTILNQINKELAPYKFSEIYISPKKPKLRKNLSAKLHLDSSRSVKPTELNVTLTAGEEGALAKVKTLELKQSLKAFWMRCKQVQQASKKD